MLGCIVLGYLFNFGKAATEQVAKTAKQFRETVEEKVTELCENFSTCLYGCKCFVINVVCRILLLFSAVY